jgi:hypothetical protein
VLRTYGVAGALAAAALALVIGIFVVHAQMNSDQNRPFATGPQHGVADHAGVSAQSNTSQPAQAQSEQGQRPVTASGAQSGPSDEGAPVRVTASGGGNSASAVQPQASSCGGGLLGGLVAALGGLLGSGGSAC